MKKFVALVLALCVMLTLAVFPVSAEFKTEVLECVEDGGFENEKLSPYWGLDGFTENPTIVSDPANAQNQAMRIADVNIEDTAAVYATYDVQNIAANTEINISADVYREDFHVYGTQMYVDFFKTEAPDYNAYIDARAYKNLVFDDRDHDKSWNTFTIEATVPAEALSARVAFSTKNGEILIDNFSVKAAKKVYKRVGSELIENGDFDTMDSNGIPVGLGAAKDTFDKGILSVSDDVRAGAAGTSVKIEQTGVNPYAMIGKTGSEGRYYDFVAGETYTVSLWKKSPYMTKYWNFRLNFEFYSGNQVAQPLQIATKAFYLGNGGANNWTKYEDEFTVPEGTKMFRVFFSASETGTYYVDDLSIMGPKKPQISQNTNEKNILLNGSFEEKTAGKINSWNIPSGSLAVWDSFETGAAYDENTFFAPLEAGEFISSAPTPVKENTRYAASVYYKATAANSVRLAVIQEGADAAKSIVLGSTDGVWQKAILDFVVQPGVSKVRFEIGSVANDSGMAFDLAQICEYTEFITNGNFETTADGSVNAWTYDGDFTDILKTDNTNYLAFDAEKTYAETTVSGVEGGKTYVLTADCKSTADSAAVVGIRTPGYDNKESGDSFANRFVNYNYQFASTGGEWKKLSFNITAADAATEIKVLLGAATAGGGVAFDNISLKETTNLISNGDFEGIPIVNYEVFGIETVLGIPAFTAKTEGFAYHTDDARQSTASGRVFAESDGTVIATVSTPGKPGKSYRVSGYVKTDVASKIRLAWTAPWFSGNSAANGGQLEMTKLNGSWEEFEYFVTLPKDDPDTSDTLPWNGGEVQLQFRINNAVRGNSFLIDDLRMEEVSSVSAFYNEKGEAIESFKPGETVRIVKVQTSDALTDAPDSFTMIAAVYKVLKNGATVLDSISAIEEKGTKYYPAQFSHAVTMPDDGNVYELRIFVWKDLASMQAVSAKTVLMQEEAI